jgi:hypothetical protein
MAAETSIKTYFVALAEGTRGKHQDMYLRNRNYILGIYARN